MGNIKISESSERYMGFTLDDENYGVPINMVCEIIGAVDITKVPSSPEHVEGVINLRGKIIPMIDLKSKFGMNKTNFTKETCFLIVDVEEKQVGVIVDKVDEVMDFNTDQVESAKELSEWQDSEYLLGIGKLENKVIILVNLSGALSNRDITSVVKRATDMENLEVEEGQEAG